MIQYITYLNSDIGKLRNRDESASFLASCTGIAEQFGLSNHPDQLAKSLETQSQVTAFVASLSDQNLQALCKSCSNWRRNNVWGKLQVSGTWIEGSIDPNRIYLQQAEPELGDGFRRHEYNLVRIANDASLMSQIPYCNDDLTKDPEYPVCLGEADGDNIKLFDGVHRAIKLVRRSHDTIRVVYRTST